MRAVFPDAAGEPQVNGAFYTPSVPHDGNEVTCILSVPEGWEERTTVWVLVSGVQDNSGNCRTKPTSIREFHLLNQQDNGQL